MTKPLFAKSNPEFVAVILASSVGTRLFPLTSSPRHPKHLVEVAGIPILHRLLKALEVCGLTECVIAIQHEDTVTTPALEQFLSQEAASAAAADANSPPPPVDPTASAANTNESATIITKSASSSTGGTKLLCTVCRLTEDCPGTGEALRQVEKLSNASDIPVIPPDSHIIVFPGDLIVLDHAPIQALLQAHRQGNAPVSIIHNAGAATASLHSACTVLLADVGEQDEHGAPLKESAKQKKGGLGRDEEEIEYIALSYPCSTSSSSSSSSSDHMIAAPRMVWKQNKLEVEENQDLVSDTRKLEMPKPRLRQGRTKVRTDWNDVHVYAFAPWVRLLLQSRETAVLSLKDHVLPLLLTRQFKGIVATFGSSMGQEDDREDDISSVLKDTENSQKSYLETVMKKYPHLVGGKVRPRYGGDSSLATDESDHFLESAAASSPLEYAVRAIVQPPTILRAHTVPAYLFANRQIVHRTIEQHGKPAYLQLPTNSTVNPKFQSVVLKDSSIGDQVTFKSTVVGQGCKIGSRCRLNNVVLLNDVTVGDNTILQNTVVATGARIAENCNLNDCQVGAAKVLAAGTKEKGETFLTDNMDI